MSANIYDKRDNFDFDIVNFPFVDGDIPRAEVVFTSLSSFALLGYLVIYLILCS